MTAVYNPFRDLLKAAILRHRYFLHFQGKNMRKICLSRIRKPCFGKPVHLLADRSEGADHRSQRRFATLAVFRARGNARSAAQHGASSRHAGTAFGDMWRDLKAGLRHGAASSRTRRKDGGFYWVVANVAAVCARTVRWWATSRYGVARLAMKSLLPKRLIARSTRAANVL